MHTTQPAAKPDIEAPPTEIALRRTMNRVGSASALVSASNLTTVGERMIHRRLQMGLTQAQVSSQIRQGKSGKALSRNAYCMYETGKYEPKLKLIEQAAAALDVPAGWLAFGTEDYAGNVCNAGAATAPISISYRWSGLQFLTPNIDR